MSVSRVRGACLVGRVLSASVGTPKSIMDRMAAAMRNALETPGLRKLCEQLGMDLVVSRPDLICCDAAIAR